MSKELTISIDGKERRFFLQTGFYSHTKYKSLEFHRHSYPEIHIFLNCDARFFTADGAYSVTDGNALMVPRELLHAYKMSDGEGSLHCTFQLDAPCDRVTIKKLPTGLAKDLLEKAAALGACGTTVDHTPVLPHLAFIGTAFISQGETHTKEVRDYAFLMREYMEHNYAKNITLADLAKTLRISKKQTERLAAKHLGKTFLEELTAIRMNAADILIRIDKNKNLTEIAPLVGYQSYSGFYKAYKKHKDKNKNKKALRTEEADIPTSSDDSQ